MRSKARMAATPSQKQKIKQSFTYALWAIGIATIVGIITFIAINLGRHENALAAGTFTSTPTGGNWAIGTSWNGGTGPGNWANNTANVNGNITLTSTTTAINGFTLITLNNGKSFISGTSTTANNLSMQSVTFNIIDGNVTIYGNLTLSSSTLSITSGSLTVTGALNINSGATVNVASGTTITANTMNISNNNDAILNNNGTVTVPGNVSQGGVVNNNSGGILQVNGSITSTGSGSSIITNAGSLNVAGSITLPNSGKLYDHPGGKIVVDNNITVSGNLNLVIGTNVSPPLYADLVIKKNLISSSSGDVLFDKNSRAAIYGYTTDSGDGGTLFTVNNGGEVYINGDITYSGGGDAITNNNVINPFGLYVNGTTTNSGGGSATTANKGSKAVMKSTNTPFYNWVSLQADSPLPVTLVAFRVSEITSQDILLTWATASEENFDKFVVERSANGKVFEAIDEISGAGNSKKLLAYAYTDKSPLSGANYYRLKSVDLNGKFEYAPVLFADFNGSDAKTPKTLSLYPNPSNGEFINFKVDFDPGEGDVISIMDLSGAEIIKQTINERDGRIAFNVPLKTGAYIVKYTSTKFNSLQRMIVK